MTNQMQRFTQHARQALSYAQDEAKQFHHGVIGSAHLLLGLIRTTDGIAQRTLHELGLDYKQLQHIVGNLNPQTEPSGEIAQELGEDTKRILEGAVEEARGMEHHFIGTEHLLLGLVRQENRAVEILAELGVSPEEVRRYTRRVMQEPPPTAQTVRTTIPEAMVTLRQLMESQPSLNADLMFYSWMQQQYKSQINEVLKELNIEEEQFWSRLRKKLTTNDEL